ncbi:hypothetical protein Rhopal_004401-T1 [Rhodotorula paludigena]|uniref:RRM domain-containing protein n=1 Tax=Rhodotorula paludigena TaxID=86838 RepID=A0AAV5GPD2_9BASI|nr:hypothetical protein Rhopal_004401-T1 [Rhodotorula paludigena]
MTIVVLTSAHVRRILQFPDSVTATHAQTTLHGTPFDGHLVNLHPVNELRHNWTKFSLQIHGVPPNWTYRVVSDALVTTICRFAGLVARPKPPRYDELKVKVEFWYASEAVWAARELDGKLLAVGHPIRAVLDSPQLQRKALGPQHAGDEGSASERSPSLSGPPRSTAPSSPAATTHRSREGSRDVEMRDVDVDVAPPAAVVVKPLGALSSSTSGAVTARSGSSGARDGVWKGARKMHGVV